MFFFFKQKTAYEMRISDWSSDVCSSDLLSALGVEARSDEERRRYAEMQVKAEARRVEKLLAYQRAYDEAWQRLNPGMQRVNLPDDLQIGRASCRERVCQYV